MRFISFSAHGRASFGAVTDSGIVDLGAKHDDLVDLRAAIRAGRLGELAAEAAANKAQ